MFRGQLEQPFIYNTLQQIRTHYRVLVRNVAPTGGTIAAAKSGLSLLAQGNKPVDKLMRECSARHRERFWELIDMRTASIVLACMVLAGCAGKV